MTVELNTNLVRFFSGTYGSIWDELTEQDDDGKELYLDYKHEDLMRSIAEAYQYKASEIKRDLNIDFIKELRFTGGFYSPTEYNFKNDELDFTVDIDEEKLGLTIDRLENDEEFNKWLHEHYTSRDGFWSWTPNNYKELSEAIINHGDSFEQSIGALVSYLGRDAIKGDDFYNSIEGMVFEDWRSNGYGGLDYTLVDDEGNPCN